MKLDGPISNSPVDDDKEIQASESSPEMATITVGYALTSKKKKSFLKPKFIRLARSEGIEFVQVDPKRPLSEQGPFDIILHKLEGKDWHQVIKDYQRVHPEVTVIDPPDAIQRLRNRQSMLEVVADLNLPDSYGNVCIPRQLVISKDPSSVVEEVAKAGLSVPLVP